MGHIFLSYARSDAAKARLVVAALSNAGYDVWWDEHLPTHRTYYEVIEEQLRTSHAVVVLWSKAATDSQWVRAEADMGRTLGKLVQARVDTELPPMPFNQIQCARLDEWNGSADHPDWLKVLDGVRAIGGDGERHPPPVSLSTRRHGRTTLTLGVAFATILLAWLTWLIVRDTTPTEDATVEGERVAVLDFTAEASLVQFTRALADRIVDVMSTNDLQAIPNASSDEYRGAALIASAARNGVSFVLDGAVRQDADALSVNTHIVDARANVTLWSNTYHRAVSEGGAMQEQVAAHVVDVLRCALVSRRPNAGPIDPRTLAIFMRACDVAQRFDAPPEEIYESARQVTVRAPQFSRGWSLLAMASALASRNVSPQRRDSLLGQSKDAAEKARSLDPGNAESDLALSLIIPQRNWHERQALVARAIENDPNSSEAHLIQGILLAEVGRLADALGSFRRAVALDPLSPINWSSIPPTLAATGNLMEAKDAAERMQQLWPDSPSIWFNRFNRLVFSRQAEAALVMLDAVDSAPIAMEQPMRAAWRKYLLALRDGSQEVLKAAVMDIADLAGRGQFDMSRAISAASQVGEVDIAYALADSYFQPAADPVFAEPMAGGSRYSLFLPPSEAMRRDKRFMELMRRRGLVAYWRESGKWPDFCADPGLLYDCQSEGAKEP